MGNVVFRPGVPFFKNRIINGDFQIWQRGTSASYASNSVVLTAVGGYKSADRIICGNRSAGGQFTISKGELNGFSSFRITVDTPPDNLTWDGTNQRFWQPFQYKFEGYHLYDLIIKKIKVTVSFLFRSNVSGIFGFSFRNTSYLGQNGTFNQTQMDTFVSYFQYDGSENVKKISITIPLDYSWVYGVFNDEKVGFDLLIGFIGDAYTTDILNQWQSGTVGNSSGASLLPNIPTGYTNWATTAGNYIEMSQLQLEEGEVATEFEYVPYDIQLLRCMRYYEKIERATALKMPFTDDTGGYCRFIVEKRVVPTITFIRPSDEAIEGADYYYTGGTDLVGVTALDVTRSGVVFGAFGYTPPTTNDARLYTNILADAEL